MLEDVADKARLLAARPATPIFSAPYKLIALFLQGGGRSSTGPLQVWRSFSAPMFQNYKNQLAIAATSPRSIVMYPITNCGVGPVMSIWLTRPALAIAASIAAPAESTAVTVSL